MLQGVITPVCCCLAALGVRKTSHKTQGEEFGAAGGSILTSVIPRKPTDQSTALTPGFALILRFMELLRVVSIHPGTAAREG